MQRKSLGVLVVLIVAMMLVTVSCQKKQVQSTSPETPDVTAAEEGKMAQEEAAAQEVDEEAIAAEAARREQERARMMFISEDIYFDFDDASLTATAQETLQRKAVWLQNNPDAAIVIEGHCDERGSAEYNLALGDRRAQSAKAYLADLGIPNGRITTISYGEEMPVDPRQNEEAYAKNRRAHFTVK